MDAKQVLVAGGDLFEISPKEGVYYIYKVKNIFTNWESIEVGKADNLDDAINFIETYSGKQISAVRTVFKK
ncbi:MAG: hypothetical protein PHV04_01370 [Clostridia bacterium]|nr:hypothetical protein [Clostridia bacterium]